jgi:hypothetical protein
MNTAVKKYKVIIEGSKIEMHNDISMQSDSARQSRGFFTTRILDAEGPDIAAELAVKSIRSELEADPRNNMEHSLIYIAGVSEVPADTTCDSEQADLNWFIEKRVSGNSIFRKLKSLLGYK